MPSPLRKLLVDKVHTFKKTFQFFLQHFFFLVFHIYNAFGSLKLEEPYFHLIHIR
jgi:hypothetical protein